MTPKKSILILGAGVCGLLIAQALQKQKCRVTVWEKSKGVGGRMATRRSEGRMWDHGAQFFSFDKMWSPWIEVWLRSGLIREWPFGGSPVKYYAPRGMTAVAKDLGTGLLIQKERQLASLHIEDRSCRALDIQGANEVFDGVIFTCPLPQTVALLQTSGLESPHSWTKLTYASALVGLIEWNDENRLEPFYRESLDQALFSVTDMQTKGVSQDPAWTVVANPAWSLAHWDAPEKEQIQALQQHLLQVGLLQESQRGSWQMKKWKYSHPTSTLSPALGWIRKEPLILASGDSFGGGSVAGASRAAAAAVSLLAEVD